MVGSLHFALPRATADRGATNIDSCVIQLHQTDCCGRRAAYGVNHDARSALCTAETACDAMYPAAGGCSDDTIVTDAGETTTMMANVKVRLVRPTPCAFDPTMTCYACETFVCTSDTCRGDPGITGGCG